MLLYSFKGIHTFEDKTVKQNSVTNGVLKVPIESKIFSKMSYCLCKSSTELQWLAKYIQCDKMSNKSRFL